MKLIRQDDEYIWEIIILAYISCIIMFEFYQIEPLCYKYILIWFIYLALLSDD